MELNGPRHERACASCATSWRLLFEFRNQTARRWVGAAGVASSVACPYFPIAAMTLLARRGASADRKRKGTPDKRSAPGEPSHLASKSREVIFR